MIEAAGILLVSPAGRVLLLKRSSEGDAQGLWALPGGKVEKGETALQAALRETWEKLGWRAGGVDRELMRRVKDDVDYTTFLKKVDSEFTPKLNEEHTAWAWVDPKEVLTEQPPAPVTIQ